MKKDDSEVVRLAAVINYISSKLMDEGATPELVAGVLAACALSIYKATLTESDFQEMIDQISACRNEVSPFIRGRESMTEDMLIAAHSKYIH